MTARNWSSVIFTIRASLVMPALLTSTVISPSTASRMRRRSSGLVTSATMPSTDGSRSTRSTSWSAARRSATARPMPRAAPVTTAVMGAPCARPASPVRAHFGFEIASRISYLDLAHVRRVHADEFAGHAAAALELGDPVLQVLRIGVGADRDGVGPVALGGQRAHPAQQRVGQHRAGHAVLTEQVRLAEHEDDRLLVASRFLGALEGGGERGLDLGEVLHGRRGEDHASSRSL